MHRQYFEWALSYYHNEIEHLQPIGFSEANRAAFQMIIFTYYDYHENIIKTK